MYPGALCTCLNVALTAFMPVTGGLVAGAQVGRSATVAGDNESVTGTVMGGRGCGLLDVLGLSG